MRKLRIIGFGLAVVMSLAAPLSAQNGPRDEGNEGKGHSIQLGPRPFFLVEDMEESRLKSDLLDCFGDPVKRTEFSIGHRGAALMFPEHTKESYEAGARIGAGILECDVTFTKDKELVCRHAQNDLATTTNIRTDLYSGPTSGHLLTHKESIELFKNLGVKMTPELKAPSVPMPFNGFTQQDYAQKMINEYKAAGVSPQTVFPQSFDINDVLYWVNHEPAFGDQAVFLEDANVPADLPTAAHLRGYRAMGIKIWGPPTFALLALQGPTNSPRIVPSQYARDARNAGLDIITWTLERSGILADGNWSQVWSVVPIRIF